MKKIIYSIAAALILSFILALIFPTWFLEGDARRAYQNGAARIDVKFGGNLKNGRVDAKGTGFQILHPTWLSNDNYQGTCLLIPVTYQNKTCRIEITPQAEEWGEDATLVIELKGRDFQHRGKRRPAWVSFRNITLNGQPVEGEKVVWHNTPFVLRYPLHSSQGITLAFDVCKPLAASDISFVNLLVVFLAFLLPCLFWASLRKAANHALTFIDRKDVVMTLKDSYLHIDPVYRRSFWIIFGVLCFAFGFHTICFMWGNHDWVLLDRTHRWNEHAWEGRYMASSVKALLSEGVYLPFVYDVITFITLALNAVLLCKYWHLKKRVIYYVLCGLVLTAQPFTLGMLYFVNMTPEVFIGVSCVLVALILSENIATGGGYTIRYAVCLLLPIVLINFALAMYPVLINTIAVAFIGRLLVHSFDWDGSWRQLKSGMKPVMTAVLTIALGIALYKLILTFAFPPVKYYNTETLPVHQVPERLGILFKQCFHQLYEYNLPFVIQWVLWIFLGFTILLTLYICLTGNFKQKTVRLILLFGSLFGTKTAVIIAKTCVIADRVELFGLVFFEVLVMVLVLTQLRKLHNISVAVGACVASASIINDLDCLRVWKLGFDAEKMLWNRVLARLEIQKGFSPFRKYDVVQVGHSISLRPRFYTGKREKYTSDPKPILLFSYDAEFGLFRAHELYYPTRFRRGGFTAYYGSKPGYEARLRRLYQAGVLQKAEVWPKQNGLIVWGDIILFVTDGKELERCKKQFERELGKK